MRLIDDEECNALRLIVDEDSDSASITTSTTSISSLLTSKSSDNSNTSSNNQMDTNTSTNASSNKNKERIITSLTILLGIGSCMPWFVFINAVEYFSIRFCSSMEEEKWIKDDFEAMFGFVSNASNVVTLVVILIIEKYNGGDTPSSGGEAEMEESQYGVILCFIISLVVLCVHVILVLVTSSAALTPITLFWICTISLIIFGVCSAYTTTKVLAQLMKLFPSHIGITPYTAGISLGGLLVSLISVATSLMDQGQRDDYIASHCTSSDHHRGLQEECVPYSIDYITLAYFLTPCAILIACIFAYRHLTTYFPLYSALNQHSDTVSLTNHTHTALQEPLLDKQPKPTSTTLTNYNVYSKLSYLILTIFLIYLCTCTLFPGYIGTITSVNQCKALDTRRYNDLFTPILFITFNIFELAGKLLAPHFYSFTTPVTTTPVTTTTHQSYYDLFLMLLSLTRLVLLLYLFTLTPLQDIYTLTLTAFLGLTNGCLANTCFLHTIQLTDKHQTTSASAIINFFLCIGLFTGSTFSIFYSDFISNAG